MPFTAYIGIGSNQPLVGQTPEQLVTAAISDLAKIGSVTARSSLYRTQPVGIAEQPPFVNAAATLQTPLDPESLLQALIQIEHRYGRDRAAGVLKGPRTLDLDLLLINSANGQGIVRDSPSLTLPHPELHLRRFVLAPLAEIAPMLRHPTLGKTIAELLAALPAEGANAIAAVKQIQADPIHEAGTTETGTEKR